MYTSWTLCTNNKNIACCSSLLHLTHQPFQLLAVLHPASSSQSAYRPVAGHCTISGWLSQNACQLLGHCNCIIAPASCLPLYLHHCPCQLLAIAFASLPLPVAGLCICIIAPASCWPLYLHHCPCQLLSIAFASLPLPVAGHFISPASCCLLHHLWPVTSRCIALS